MKQPGWMTRKRKAVLELVVQGLTAEEIGERLGNKPATIEHHLATLRELVGVARTPRLVYIALRKGWVSIEPETKNAPVEETPDR